MGHEMRHVYGYFPLNPSMGLAAVVVSYNGRISISLILDQGIIKNGASLERYLKDAYYDLAGGLPERQEPPPPMVTAEPPVVMVEAPVPATSEVVSQNGHKAEPLLAVPPVNSAAVAAEPLEQPAPILTQERHPLFSDGWALALQEAVNQSEDYRSVSMNWTAGSLAFIMEAAPEYGYDTTTAVWLDLYRGVCRSARALSPQEALREATFVIQGTYAAWMDALSGRAAPLVMLTNGRLKLKKGALLRLLPHTRSAGELVRCAQRVS
jgi:putative sterol carrier protein